MPATRVAQVTARGVDSGEGDGDRGSLGPEAAGCALLAGAYITDGCSLFRIEHTHTDRVSGETFVELENCATLELSVWSLDTLAARPLRYVGPVGASAVGASELHDAAYAREIAACSRVDEAAAPRS
jgi:hypothetical protein